jgi:hypothetical protein
MQHTLWQATIKFGRPGQSKTDDELSEHLTDTFHTGKKALKAVKQLWGNSLDELGSCERKARKFHKNTTFDGIGDIRVCVEAEREKWLATMEEYADAYRALARQWLDNYEIWLEQERYDKNGAFRIEDYPCRESLATKFRVHFAILPMPEPNAFVRDALTDELGKRLAADYETRLKNTTAQISRTVLDTLLGLISETAESLANDGPIVDSENRKGPLAKLQEYLDRIPALNITGDPTITAIAEQARTKLAYSADALRKNQQTRQLASIHATNIALQFGASTRKIAKAA